MARSNQRKNFASYLDLDPQKKCIYIACMRKFAATKSLTRITKRMVKDPPMELISMRLPRHMIDELKEIAVAKGFTGYQGLIRFYVSQGARKDLEEMDAPKLDNIAKALKAHGVSKKVIDQALQAA